MARPVPVAVDEAEAYQRLERLRWGDEARCPHCGSDRCRFLPAAGGVRRTRTGAPTPRRVWRCAACRRQFSVLVGTVLEGTRLPVSTWLAALDAWAQSGRPPAPGARPAGTPAARHIRRRLAVAAATPAVGAWTPADGADALLRAVLTLSAAEAERIRHATPTRVRPRPQTGPSADYGTRR